MTPGARLAAVIELLDTVAASERPADGVVAHWLRERRYIGATDRQVVTEKLWQILRRLSRLSWHLRRAGLPVSGRGLALFDLRLADGFPVEDLALLCREEPFGPPPLSPLERQALERLEGQGLTHAAMPADVALEIPDWAAQPLRQALGQGFAEEMEALRAPAPMDLRVNLLKGDREQARAALAQEGITAAPGRWSPWSLRVEARVALTRAEAYLSGLVEIQDEGSQLLCQLTQARPGEQVLDFCAGAGGKTLAMAQMMANRGQVLATDTLAGRLTRSRERLARAGVDTVRLKPITHERDPFLKRYRGHFDLVLVDAPCTGTGTWRRSPDARWRRLGPDLQELVALQAAILDSAARLVRPGGRLVYGTCSLLREENAGQVEGFLSRHPGFRLRPAEEILPLLPPGPAGPGYLSLTPLRHDTDGFFGAVLLRSEQGDAAP